MRLILALSLIHHQRADKDYSKDYKELADVGFSSVSLLMTSDLSIGDMESRCFEFEVEGWFLPQPLTRIWRFKSQLAKGSDSQQHG